jgi:hypothetical protein
MILRGEPAAGASLVLRWMENSRPATRPASISASLYDAGEAACEFFFFAFQEAGYNHLDDRNQQVETL